MAERRGGAESSTRQVRGGMEPKLEKAAAGATIPLNFSRAGYGCAGISGQVSWVPRLESGS